MKILHIFHSGFLVKIENLILVFDCLDNTIANYFSDSNDVYVFISHSHSDHYSKEVFDWERKHPKIKYFLGDDIKLENKKTNYYFMEKYQYFNVDDLKIESFGSTDKGVSFLITLDDINIFHAGDLNWWHWQNDSKEIQKKEENDFKNEVEKLKNRNIDIAFIPVDPRLKEYYYLAAEYFVETIKPKVLIPMHFGNNFSITRKIKDKLSGYDVDVFEIEGEKQEFDISLKKGKY